MSKTGSIPLPAAHALRKLGRDLALAHFPRMALSVEEDEALDPMHVSLFGADAQMAHPDSLSHALQEG